MRGFLYIVSNRSMPGLLKVGYTTRSVAQRLAELASTGVPSNFALEFFCEVDEAAALERKVHFRLRNAHHNKEFFKCSTGEAVRAAKTELLSGAFVVHNIGGAANGAFLTPQEQHQIAQEATVLTAEHEKELAQQQIASRLEAKFRWAAPTVDFAIKKYCSLGKHEAVKAIASLGVALTAPLHLGTGFLLFDKIDPCGFDDGRATAKKLTAEERTAVCALFSLIAELRLLNAWPTVAERFYTPNQFLVHSGSSGYDVSDLLQGVFLGLKLVKSS